MFSERCGLTPVSGRIDLIKYYFEPVTGFMLIDALLSGQPGAFRSALQHLILPTIVLGTMPLAVIARMTRSSMLEVLSEDYVRTARAKGLSPFRVIGVHALRNALIPVVTIIGLQVGTLLAGAVLTETIFSWPGVGKWLIESICRRDYRSLQGGILLISAHRHPGQPHRRHALRRDQPADPSWPLTSHHRGDRSTDHRRPRRAPCGAFWASFSREPWRGRRCSSSCRSSCFIAIFADVIAPHMRRSSSSASASRVPPVWDEGGNWSSSSARMRSAATSLSRLIYGARLSLFIGAVVVCSRWSVGMLLGLSPPSSAARSTSLIMRLMDLILAFPSLVLAILIVAVLGRA